MNNDNVIEVLQRLHDMGPLDPRNKSDFDTYYIPDLHSQHGDLIARLAADISVASGSRHAYLFTGTIGSGKSTELRRLAEQLLTQGHYPLVFDARDYLNEQLVLGIPDLLLAMSLAMWEALCEMEGREPDGGERWNWWKSLLQTEPQGKEVEAGLGIAKLKFVLRDNPTVRESMRRHQEQLLDTFVQNMGEFMRDCAEKIRFQKQVKPNKKLVLIVDSLEHFGGKAAPGQKDEVLASLLHVFNTHARHLQLPDWSVVYSVTPLLPKLSPGLTGIWGMSSTYALTSAHVFKDRSDEPDTTVLEQQLVPLLQKRLGQHSAQLFNPADLQNIALTSGGDLRDMLRITRSALLKAYTAGQYPVSDALIEQSFADLRRPYLPLSDQTRQRLQHVALHHDVPLKTDADWPSVMADLAQKRILQYRNGQEWYGVHPLLKEATEPATAAAAPLSTPGP